jgi:hypothetical protein
VDKKGEFSTGCELWKSIPQVRGVFHRFFHRVFHRKRGFFHRLKRCFIIVYIKINLSLFGR